MATTNPCEMITGPLLTIESAVTVEFGVEPVVLAGATAKLILPPAPVPVPIEPVIVAFAPAVFDVAVTTDWKLIFWATGAAASAAPCWMLAVPLRVRIVSPVALPAVELDDAKLNAPVETVTTPKIDPLDGKLTVLPAFCQTPMPFVALIGPMPHQPAELSMP